MSAFNASFEKSGEEGAIKIAWGAVKRVFEKIGDKWVKKEENAIEPQLIKLKSGDYQILNKPITKVGDISKVTGNPYTIETFQKIINNFVGNTIPIRANTFGHLDNKPNEPAPGWVSNPRIIDDYLVVDIKDIPKQAGEWFNKGYYRNTSSEIIWRDGINPHLLRISFLGSEPPNFIGLPTFDKAIEENNVLIDKIDVLETNYDMSNDKNTESEVILMDNKENKGIDPHIILAENETLKSENQKLQESLSKNVAESLEKDKEINSLRDLNTKITKAFNDFKKDSKTKEFNSFVDSLKIGDENLRKQMVEQLVRADEVETNSNDSKKYVEDLKNTFKTLAETVAPPQEKIEANAKTSTELTMVDQIKANLQKSGFMEK